MDKDAFVEVLRKTANELGSQVSDAKGDWAVKGFIDVSKNIYTISSDTKVISKILELYIFPRLLMFA